MTTCQQHQAAVVHLTSPLALWRQVKHLHLLPTSLEVLQQGLQCLFLSQDHPSQVHLDKNHRHNRYRQPALLQTGFPDLRRLSKQHLPAVPQVFLFLGLPLLEFLVQSQLHQLLTLNLEAPLLPAAPPLLQGSGQPDLGSTVKSHPQPRLEEHRKEQQDQADWFMSQHQVSKMALVFLKVQVDQDCLELNQQHLHLVPAMDTPDLKNQTWRPR